ncbi:hypothetical protein AAU61_07365 [Desulfocarbo indianensis]|nr:hypothetical protein AAU61_07365 [Desulfocarbo indianensis]
MSALIITEAIMSSQSTNGMGQFIRRDMDRDEKDLLWSISKKQAYDWRDNAIIPWQLLEVFRTWGLDFMGARTISDVPLLKFVDHLKRYMREAPNKFDREAAENIYYSIVQNDLMPRRMQAGRRAETKAPVFQNAA